MPDSAQFALHRPELRDSLLAGEEKIARLLKGREQTYQSGDVLIEAHTDHQFVYRLMTGWAGRIRSISDGREQCILVFLPGDLFAVKSMFVTRHPDRVKILSAAIVQRIGHRELHQAFREDADVASRCIWQVMEEERRLHNWVVGLGQGSAEERLAMLLLDFHGRLILSGTIAPGALSYHMPLTQSQLADHLGVTPVHVNRVLKSFRESGVVLVREGEVVILDLTRLAQAACPLLDTFERRSPAHLGRAMAR
jgi:CRP/FNR family transcriptional regulator, anaerobic regulatory protein